MQGSYIDVHDNEVVNLSIGKATVQLQGEQLPKESAPTEVPVESELWEKVKEAGLVNEDGQPTVSRTEAAILADILLEKMGKEHEWTLFEKMWNRKNMRNDWQAALELKKFDEVREKIKKKLC